MYTSKLVKVLESCIGWCIVHSNLKAKTEHDSARKHVSRIRVLILCNVKETEISAEPCL